MWEQKRKMSTWSTLKSKHTHMSRSITRQRNQRTSITNCSGPIICGQPGPTVQWFEGQGIMHICFCLMDHCLSPGPVQYILCLTLKQDNCCSCYIFPSFLSFIKETRVYAIVSWAAGLRCVLNLNCAMPGRNLSPCVKFSLGEYI